ncbi:bifunctional glutamate N-acetyltransferase/amino-acid acetyltransferase ArgJ [Buchananella felis]|uniref:bifunctional glutamate N-acetyltransferase/amino-acid acetyltransferase ArgJ n=1 Tax=Buchananella felis TaxID=3231492 RepID=UPI0035275E78
MSVTFPAGFQAAGVTAGLRASGKPDLALVVNTGPLAAAAAVTTANRVHAAAVDLTRANVADGAARAVVINSGNANACTGPQGARDAADFAATTARALGLPAGEVLVGQTGVIGHLVDMPKLLAGVEVAVAQLSEQGGPAAAQAILTTDTVDKQVELTAPAGWRVGGMAKGAGMLAPALATMLCVITTDAACEPADLDAALKSAVARTFNRLDSDGCMSTNDTVFALASGACGLIASREELTEVLTEACRRLALGLLADAEGANHDVAVTVRGASSVVAAEAVGRAVTRSNLVKTAIFGNDPNWGRIVAQVGTVPAQVAPFDPADLEVIINGKTVCEGGLPACDPSEVDMSPRQCEIVIDLHAGKEEATVWTNDLTHAYVHINSAYTT